jgi:hypothetical protein
VNLLTSDGHYRARQMQDNIRNSKHGFLLRLENMMLFVLNDLQRILIPNCCD